MRPKSGYVGIRNNDKMRHSLVIESNRYDKIKPSQDGREAMGNMNVE